jgi:hypothetical protein
MARIIWEQERQLLGRLNCLDKRVQSEQPRGGAKLGSAVAEEAADAEPCSAELIITGNVVCSGYAGKVGKMLQRFRIDEDEMSLQAWP